MRILPPRRPGALSSAWLAFVASGGVLAGLVLLLAFDPAHRGERQSNPLVVFCASGLKAPVVEAAREYEGATGVAVQLQFGGSNTLLAGLELSERADLFLPADDTYVQAASGKGLVGEVVLLANMRPALVVREGNPKGVRSIDDVIARGLRVAQANPESAAIGRLTREILTRSGQWEPLEACVAVTKPTVTDVAGDVALGSVDAGFVWDVTVRQIPGLRIVPDPALARASALVSACVVRSSKRQGAALEFARFLAAPDGGGKAFAALGFSPAVPKGGSR